MMKKLILMRHAKSAWNTDAPSDHARPLNERGRKSAPLIAKKLKELNLQVFKLKLIEFSIKRVYVRQK